ncbi:MAG: hypothetical protein QM570_04270 [Planctomycetota bacterium]|jgi:hypothetical protein|nr:hypothetical protein [Planctomycetota bacterium]
MKKRSIALVVAALLALTAATASADMEQPQYDALEATYDFVDLIDYWYVGQDQGWFDAVRIDEYFVGPVSYQHDITDDGVPAEYYVTEAWLELDFTNEERPGNPDAHYNGLFLKYDRREYVTVAYDGVAQDWYDVTGLTDDEIDDGAYELVVGIDWLADGLLDVSIGVWNPLGTADTSLDYSVLYGNLARVPVPGAVLLGVLGLSAAGIKLRKNRAA